MKAFLPLSVLCKQVLSLPVLVTEKLPLALFKLCQYLLTNPEQLRLCAYHYEIIPTHVADKLRLAVLSEQASDSPYYFITATEAVDVVIGFEMA